MKRIGRRIFKGGSVNATSHYPVPGVDAGECCMAASGAMASKRIHPKTATRVLAFASCHGGGLGMWVGVLSGKTME
jgi:hypothetical protein